MRSDKADELLYIRAIQDKWPERFRYLDKRKRNPCNRKTFAAEEGINYSGLSRYLRKKSTPDLAMVKKIQTGLRKRNVPKEIKKKPV